jgi:Zn-dependent alcohol dehydrogenase
LDQCNREVTSLLSPLSGSSRQLISTSSDSSSSSIDSNHFKVDTPKYIDFYTQGQLKLDEMITRRACIEGLNEAFRTMKASEVPRQVLVFN